MDTADEMAAAIALADDLVTRAEREIADGDPQVAVNLVVEALNGEGVNFEIVERSSRIFMTAGRPQDAVNLLETMARGMEGALQQAPDDPVLLTQIGKCRFTLGDMAIAEDFLVRAAEKGGYSQELTFLICNARVSQGNAEGALAAWDALFEANPKSGTLRLAAAMLFAQHDFMDQAKACIDLAEPYRDLFPNKFDHIAAAIRGDDVDLNQIDMTVEIFDNFASGYDKNMKNIGAAGPSAIQNAMRDVGLLEDESLRILDAGCGTGLCAPLVRPFAKVLDGCDASAGMLTKCMEKNVYDTLTRTDLGRRDTYPDGMYDVVISSDVLVYFGELHDVLTLMAEKLVPGGWLVLTVESVDAALAPEGFWMGPSGRFKHTEGYVAQTMMDVGLNAPGHVSKGALRHEFTEAVEGLAIAAQKPH